MTNQAILPEDIIADGVDYAQIKGVPVRKGTVAAFLANIDLLENPNSSIEERNQAMSIMHELAPAIVTIGLHHHVTFNNKLVADIIQQAIKHSPA